VGVVDGYVADWSAEQVHGVPFSSESGPQHPFEFSLLHSAQLDEVLVVDLAAVPPLKLLLICKTDLFFNHVRSQRITR